MRLLSKANRWPLPPGAFGAAALIAVVYCTRALAQQAGGAATAPAPIDAAVTIPQKQTLWELFLAGGPVMFALLAASVLAIAIVFERLVSLRRSSVIPSGFAAGLLGAFKDPVEDRQQALAYCKSHDSAIARVVAVGLGRLPRGPAAAEKAMEDAGANEALRLRRNIRMLYAIGSVATLLGLIGTIAGMIKAFMVTAKAGNADNKVELLSTGIYEAMVCTFGGLAVAVVVTLFYYYFIGRIERLIGDINDELTRFSDEYGLNAESDAELGVTAGMDTLR